MRRLLALLAALLLAVAVVGCSDDDSSDDAAPDDSIPGSVDLNDSGVASEEFCAEIEAQADAIGVSGVTGDPEQAVAVLDDLIVVAPEVIVSDLEVVRDTAQDVVDGDLSASDLLNGELIGSVEQVGLFVEGECDLDLDTPSDGGGSADEPDDAGSTNEIDPSALRTYVEEEDPDLAPRLEAVSAVDGLEINVTVRGLEVGADGDEAVAICEIVSGFAYDEVADPDLTVRVQTTETDDVATRDGEDAACTAIPV
jgi:hypothetical protein